MSPAVTEAAYSVSLLLSLIIGGAGAAISVLVAVRTTLVRQSRAELALVALLCGATALLLGLFSFSVHRIFGHGPDSVAPMTTLRVLVHHKAYWLVLVFTVAAFGVRRLVNSSISESSRSK